MGNPIDSPLATAARDAFDKAVDQLTMKDLLKGVALGAFANVSVAKDSASNNVPNQADKGPAVSV